MAKKHHKYSHTHITHHPDGSHTVKHTHEEGPHKDKDYAVSDHDGMMDGMMEHTSAPNPGEAEADMGQHGVAPAEATAAGLPTTSPTPEA